MKPYTHFTTYERKSLEQMHEKGEKPAAIARKLGRHRSTIIRELNRNANKKTNAYNSVGATRKYTARRKNCRRKPRIVAGTPLYEYIRAKLFQYWSPETIAATWNRENPDDRVAFSTIYAAIRHHVFEGITSMTHLRRRGKRRYGGRSRFNSIQPEHTIHELPAEAVGRLRFGDFEGDTVRGKPGTGCLVTFVDRRSRLLLAAISPDMSAKSVREATLRAFTHVRQPKTILLDNGSEFAKFREIERDLGTTVYFADPHAPWQRGSNENMNGLLRFFFPKGCDFRTVTDEQLAVVLDLINSKPRFCLDLAAPADFLLHFT